MGSSSQHANHLNDVTERKFIIMKGDERRGWGEGLGAEGLGGGGGRRGRVGGRGAKWRPGLWCVETSADIPSVRFFQLNPVTVLCVLLLLQKSLEHATFLHNYIYI